MPTQRERLSAIADAIREKTGGSSPIVASSFPEAIRGITTAVPRVVGPSTVTPDDSSFEGAWQAAMAATGYWNAKASDTRVIAYSDGDGCLKPGGVVNDSEGRAVMDCSTYMGLVLRGLGYLASPYGTKLAANATVDPADVVASAEWWCEPDVDRQTDARCSDLGMRLGSAYRAITASDICRWLECQGLTWSPGERAPRVGDLCFFSKQDADGTLHYPQRWRGVSHVGIMVGPDHYLNVTDYPQSGHLIRTDVGTRPPELYGRPLWGGLSRGGGGGPLGEQREQPSARPLVRRQAGVVAGLRRGADLRRPLARDLGQAVLRPRPRPRAVRLPAVPPGRHVPHLGRQERHRNQHRERDPQPLGPARVRVPDRGRHPGDHEEQQRGELVAAHAGMGHRRWRGVHPRVADARARRLLRHL